MCGRFLLQGGWAEVRRMYDLVEPDEIGKNVRPRYNISPTQDVLFVAQEDDAQTLKEGRWWLVPHWAKEIPKYALFNARSEDAYKKPSFRDAFKSRRCLIPADGYYEWTKGADGGKDPHCITLPNFEPFSFAGLWAHNRALGITSCTILTAAAAPEIEHLHHRMPIILKPSAFEAWINPATGSDEARELLSENRGSELESFGVSRAVNSSRSEGAELIERLPE